MVLSFRTKRNHNLLDDTLRTFFLRGFPLVNSMCEIKINFHNNEFAGLVKWSMN